MTMWQRYGPGLVAGNLFGLWVAVDIFDAPLIVAANGMLFATSMTIVVLRIYDIRRGRK